MWQKVLLNTFAKEVSRECWGQKPEYKELSKCSVSRNIGYYFTKSFRREGKEYLRRQGQIKGLFYFTVWKKKLRVLDRIKKISNNEEKLEDPTEDRQNTFN